jgi:hypothetical protein
MIVMFYGKCPGPTVNFGAPSSLSLFLALAAESRSQSLAPSLAHICVDCANTQCSGIQMEGARIWMKGNDLRVGRVTVAWDGYNGILSWDSSGLNWEWV